MGFFSQHHRFLGTSIVGNWPERLDARYEAIITANKSCFAGARVLDLASHDGRWTFAAIDAGAEEVVGIEVRPELVAAAEESMDALAVPSSRFRFVVADAFVRPDIFREPFDVVLCLGFFYHTTRHMDLLELIRQTNAPTVILDTALLPGPGTLCEVRSEIVSHPANGNAENGVVDGRILVSVPTADAVKFMLSHFGYSVRQTDWKALTDRLGLSLDPNRSRTPRNPIGDYGRNERGTFVATLGG